MTVPVIRALTHQHHNVRITVLTRAFFNPFFSEFKNVIVFNPDLKGTHKGILGLLKLYKELQSLNIDMVVDLHNVLRSKILVALFKLSGIPVAQLDKGRKEKKTLTAANTKKTLFPLKTMHERYGDVFRKIGFSLDLNHKYAVNKASIPHYLKEEINGDKLLGFAPFAAYKSKALPIQKVQEVIHALSLLDSVSILLFGGGKEEKTVLENIAYKYRNVHSLVQKVSFKEELDVISNLDVMIAMDSGNGHMAALYNVPVVTIWGVTHPYLGFTPFNQPMENQIIPNLQEYPLIPTSVYGKDYPESYLSCFETISTDAILKSVLNYIS